MIGLVRVLVKLLIMKSTVTVSRPIKKAVAKSIFAIDLPNGKETFWTLSILSTLRKIFE